MANADFTPPNKEQLEVAMNAIVLIAKNIDGLYYSINEVDEESRENVYLSIRFLVSQIGLIADRCIGFSNYDVDSWALPPMFEYYANKSNQQGSNYA